MRERLSLCLSILLLAAVAVGVAPHGAGRTPRLVHAGPLFGLDTMPPVTAVIPDRTSISPNFDGRADAVAFSLGASDRSSIGGWKFQILDSGRTLVREYGPLPNEHAPYARGLLAGIVGSGVPGSIVWDGTDALERVVTDGAYTYSFIAWDEYDNIAPPVEGVIIVDNAPPQVEIKKKRYIFAPYAPGGAASLDIEVKVASGESDRCVAGILAEGDKPVRSYEWRVAGLPRTISWDGRDNEGKFVPAGVYTFFIECEDAAGNRTRREARNIAVTTQGEIADITTTTAVYSNNRGGDIEFETYLSRRAGLTGWSVSVRTRGGTELFGHSGHSALPVTFKWNGKTAGGRALDDGRYYVVLSASYNDGTSIASLPKEIVFDSTAPSVSVGRSPGTFSPDGKGGFERLAVSLSADDPSGIGEWYLSVFDAKGEVFRVFTGKGAPTERIEWGGIGGMGAPVESGSTYSLQLVATDGAGNTAGSYRVSFNVDVLVLPTDFGYHLSVRDVDFEVRDGALRLTNTGRLSRAADIVKGFSRYAVIVEGSVDASPSGERNLRLSEQFAREAMAFLVGKGVRAERITYRGMGDIAFASAGTGADAGSGSRKIDFLLIERDETDGD
ncbi:MAG TPA: OmpA family protein [Spirochaetota bacterium]|nr:OmpA family protein [Spirochaetota bacterium]HPU87952.1 OmpA family protein [Spirochaetota bacterium]